eukprot:TRINITY_DN7059_c0_g1_i3.p2 TRINITY_DN7059_c0_g1~~TRINITY_DN7059_c0_g1_i3.p2  ORF type:complete len:122 (+),score=43.08 TRINITY_DN7059_c0_g1_i3:146-511(+)
MFDDEKQKHRSYGKIDLRNLEDVTIKTKPISAQGMSLIRVDLRLHRPFPKSFTVVKSFAIAGSDSATLKQAQNFRRILMEHSLGSKEWKSVANKDIIQSAAATSRGLVRRGVSVLDLLNRS